ncbi:MAG: MmcQ/YjbR family DNA-binding protein [Paenibacillaceae bacterium]
MDHHRLNDYALNKPGTSRRYPFDPQLPVLFVGEKMFALLGHTDGIESVNLKGDPEQNWVLREQYPGVILPGYHMNKRHWNTILLNGSVPEEILLQLIDESYLLVWRGLPRTARQQ